MTIVNVIFQDTDFLIEEGKTERLLLPPKTLLPPKSFEEQ